MNAALVAVRPQPESMAITPDSSQLNDFSARRTALSGCSRKSLAPPQPNWELK
jgi:hypothetical protein